MKLGERLRELRQNKSRETLIKLSESTELSVSYLSDLERNKTTPSLQTLNTLANHFDINVTDLLGGVDFAGEKTIESLPLGLQDLVNDEELINKIGGVLDNDWIDLLASIELRGQRPTTESEWLELYISLKRILEGR
jgi:transcriptional regulator with XRE-family HTH domain